MSPCILSIADFSVDPNFYFKHLDSICLKKVTTLAKAYFFFTMKLFLCDPREMTIKETQQTIDHWIKTIGVRYFDPLTNTAILMEEVGEVARIMSRKYGEQSFKKSDEAIDLADELADVMFVVMCLANQCDIDLEQAMAKNLDKKTKRDSERHKNNEKLH